MKRGDFFIKLVSAVLFLAVASYIGLYIYDAAKNPFQTVRAEFNVIESSARVRGYVVRQERVVQGPGGAVTPVADEGEKVSAGALVANGYSGAQALTQADEARALRMRIAQLEAAPSPQSAADGSSPAFDAAARLSLAVQRRDFGQLEELCLTAESAIFAGTPESAATLPELRARLETLEASQTGVSRVYAPVSGVFSSVVDGFERIGPDSIGLMTTPDALSDMFSYAEPYSDAACKLITGIRWYYVVSIDDAAARLLKTGQETQVSFTGSRRISFDMRVEEIRAAGGIAVFSCGSGIGDVASLRYCEAEVTLGSVSGLYIPKQAIHLSDDGRTYVYVYTGGRAREESAEILGELDDMYVVRAGAPEGGPLREGAEIIVKANGLYDGKVIRG
ncbi:MAG: hypothetical protein LBJ99_04110 [Oscillospiraceae bacterium]|jgi:hypothetical protein|nr:hypothetical protein [Oscillospiraceae bacterium]